MPLSPGIPTDQILAEEFSGPWNEQEITLNKEVNQTEEAPLMRGETSKSICPILICSTSRLFGEWESSNKH